MAKYNGYIGYVTTIQGSKKGVWIPNVVEEREVYGDIMENSKRSENSEKVNKNVVLNMKISFLADDQLQSNFHNIKYATYAGTKWEVTSVTVQYPRLVAILGGVYNE